MPSIRLSRTNKAIKIVNRRENLRLKREENNITLKRSGGAGPAGADGPSALVISDDQPDRTDVIWLDTDDLGDAIDIDDLLPDQTGNAGKVLQTDGSDASWQTVSGGGDGTGTVDSVVAGTNIDVNSSDPSNPIVSLETLTISDISDINASATEVNYTDGVTSSIQTQINSKANVSHTHTASQVTDFNTEVSNNTDVTANTTARHIHANKALLDTYTQTEANLADAVAKKHTHANAVVLNATTASFTTAEETKLNGIATGAEVNVNADWNSGSGDSQILNKPSLATVAISGAYSDLSGKPTIPDDFDDLTDGTTNKAFTATEKTKLSGIATGAEVNVNADWNSGSGDSQILNKPTIPNSLDDLTGTLDDIADGASYVKSENNFTDASVTKLAGIETAADVTDATNVDAAGAVMNSDASTASMSFVIDEDSMASDSATKVPTQQSVKAYVDANAGGGGGGAWERVYEHTTTSGETEMDITGLDLSSDLIYEIYFSIACSTATTLLEVYNGASLITATWLGTRTDGSTDTPTVGLTFLSHPSLGAGTGKLVLQSTPTGTFNALMDWYVTGSRLYMMGGNGSQNLTRLRFFTNGGATFVTGSRVSVFRRLP